MRFFSMNTKSNEQSKGYRIGAVSRLTGLSADNLRVWERRLQAVTPDRTPSGDRYYNIEETSFRSRRYRGGKSIALIHQGNFVHLYSSWKIITDSLEKNNYVQNYPNWLEKIYNESDSSDPTTWNTKLVIPIQ